MPYSVPNQKWIQVHKPRVTERFLQISHEDWMQANKTLSPYGLQLYLYLASNNDNYEFALSPADAEVCAGIKNTSFRKYMKRLEEEGTVVEKDAEGNPIPKTDSDEEQNGVKDAGEQ